MTLQTIQGELDRNLSDGRSCTPGSVCVSKANARPITGSTIHFYYMMTSHFSQLVPRHELNR